MVILPHLVILYQPHREKRIKRKKIGTAAITDVIRACINKPFKEQRNQFPAWRAGTTTLLTYRPVRLHRLAESIPGLLNVYKFGF
jgi:hypothetical protein